ncbi:MAG: class I SAM-dependent methyltransferase [Chloroflexota bacterium]|nr:class I SAM-dependent methyltransferase [Chloroflexota bacterium]
MPFRESFDCLWCGRAHKTRSGEDLEGWAALCPECVGRAGDNGFLRFRLRAALEERTSAGRAAAAGSAATATSEASAISAASPSEAADLDEEMKRYYGARAREYDETYLRRGAQSRGPVLDLGWHRELDESTLWLDALAMGGDIVELAAGTGWWSPLLAQKGELSIYDANGEPLELARERLVAHGLRAHIHIRDAWQPPDREVDAVFCGFWLSHVSRTRLGDFLGIVRSWLKPGGRFAFLDEQASYGSGAPAGSADERQVRRLSDGREFTIRKVGYTVGELREALERMGFGDVEVGATATYFLMGTAVRPPALTEL